MVVPATFNEGDTPGTGYGCRRIPRGGTTSGSLTGAVGRQARVDPHELRDGLGRGIHVVRRDTRRHERLLAAIGVRNLYIGQITAALDGAQSGQLLTHRVDLGCD